VQVMTDEQAALWCKRRGTIHIGSDQQPHIVPPRVSVSISAPQRHLERLVLCRGLLLPLGQAAGYDEALLWFWDFLGSPELNETGLLAVQQMRKGLGSDASLEQAPGELFSQSEKPELLAHAFQAAIFEWIAFIIPSPLDHIIKFDEDVVRVEIGSMASFHKLFPDFSNHVLLVEKSD